MLAQVGSSNVTCLDVANALAIYFAEHCTGQFKDTYITFSYTPQFVVSIHIRVSNVVRIEHTRVDLLLTLFHRT